MHRERFWIFGGGSFGLRLREAQELLRAVHTSQTGSKEKAAVLVHKAKTDYRRPQRKE